MFLGNKKQSVAERWCTKLHPALSAVKYYALQLVVAACDGATYK